MIPLRSASGDLAAAARRWAPSADRETLQLLGAGIGGAACLALAYGVVFWFDNSAFPGDTVTYYFAGARLNAGHHLYDLSAGDPWHYEHPEFPLLGPPLVAVLWRPLAALPGVVGIAIWLIAMWLCLAWAVALLFLGTRGWAGLPVILLTPSLMLLFGVGNMDCLVLLGTVGAWMLMGTGRDRAAGVLIGSLVSLKLTPAVLLVWLILSGRWRSVRWALLSIGLLAVVAIVGTEPGIFLRYARVMVDGSTSGHPWSFAILGVGFGIAVVLRRRTGWTFAVLAALMPLGSPVAAIHSSSLLLGSLAPGLRRIPGGKRYDARLGGEVSHARDGGE